MKEKTCFPYMEIVLVRVEATKSSKSEGSQKPYSNQGSYCQQSNFHDEGPYHAETSLLLIYRAKQWTGFYMIGASAKKELMHLNC